MKQTTNTAIDTSHTTDHSANSHGEINYPAVWRRFAAMVYDSLLVTAISMAYGALALTIGHFFFDNATQFTSGLGFQFGWLLVLLAFFCFFWMKGGQTLGMRAWRLQIRHKKNLALPSLIQCVLRCTLAPIGLLLFIVGLIRKDKQCLHDLISHTQVVLTKKGA